MKIENYISTDKTAADGSNIEETSVRIEDLTAEERRKIAIRLAIIIMGILGYVPVETLEQAG